VNGRRIRTGTKFAFGIGQAAEGIKNTAFATFILLYYNQVLGLSGSLAGFAIMIALCFDAITDPLAGSLSDHWRSRWGRRHPFMYVSAIPLGVFFYFLFAPPAGLSETGLFLWLTAFAMLTRGAMTLYHVPHLALGAELSDDYDERTAIVSYRTIFGVLGNALTLILAFSFFFIDTPQMRGNLIAEAYPPFALTFGLVMVVTIFWSAIGTHDQIPHLKQVASGPADATGLIGVLAQVFADMKAALENISFRWLFSGVIIVYVMVGVQSALGLYMGNYFWDLTSGELRWLVLAGPVGVLLGAPFTKLINRRFDKRPCVVIGTAWYAFFQLSPPILRLLGLFPENDDPALLPTLLIMSVIGGMGVVQALVTAGSMMADIAAEHEYGSGRRQEGIFFGALSFSGKAASGLGNLVGGFGLDLIAFPAGAVPGAVPQGIVDRLGLLYGPLVMVFAIVAVWCYSHYRLTRARHEAILEELARRHADPEGGARLEPVTL
jgi:Na+/melibiose symporter-like transporter